MAIKHTIANYQLSISVTNDKIMIQRIQTVWLLLASVCAILSVKLSFYSGNKLDELTKAKVFSSLNGSDKVLSFMVGFMVAASLIAIFSYKNRIRQLRIVVAVALVAIINIILYILDIKSFVEGQYSISSIVTFLIPLFLLLAARNIWKDEKLVKSADRLR